MKLTSYVDYTLVLSHRASAEEVAKAASSLMRALHSGFKTFPGEFALALPLLCEKNGMKRLSVFRVFAESSEQHAKLNDHVAKSKGYDKIFIAKFAKSVSNDFSGPYVAYHRDRIKSRERPNERLAKMTSLLESNAPWIDMSSTSNDHSFRLYISTAVAAQQGEAEGEVNSYGLSRKDRPVFVPDLPA